MAHSPSPLEWSISDKRLEMGQNIDISGLVCWYVTPIYTILLLETIMSGAFLTLPMAKAKNGSENPEISSKLIHPGKYSFPWERGVWANNPGFVVALLLACKAWGVPCQLWNKSWDVSEILTQAKVSLTSMPTQSKMALHWDMGDVKISLFCSNPATFGVAVERKAKNGATIK